MPTVTLEEAQKVVSQATRKLNRKIIAPHPSSIDRVAEKEKIYVHNVGPFHWTHSLGSLGHYTIKPCPEGQPYSTLVIPGLVAEPVPVDMTKMETRFEEGMTVAQEVVGIGIGKRNEDSKIHYGVFISREEHPQKHELEAANAKLNGKYAQLVAEGDAFHDKGPNHADNITDANRMAARKLNVLRPWVRTSTVALVDCPACGRPIQPGVVRCTHEGCHAVLDEAKARKFFPELYRPAPQVQAAK